MSGGLSPWSFIIFCCVAVLCVGRAVLLVLHVDKKIQNQGLVWIAAASGVMAVAGVLDNNSVAAGINAATSAFALWQWWNNGGGDGMKKLLKKAAGYLGFGPQAAPQGA